MKLFKIISIFLAALLTAVCCCACSGIGDIMDFINSISELVPTDSGENGTSEVPDVVEKDAEGRIIKLSHYDGDGKLVFVHVQTWENDRIANKTSYDGKGNKTGSIDYEYDERGNCIVMAWFFWNSGRLMKVERKYDEYDRLIEDTGYGTETVSTNKTFLEYDDKDGEHPKNYCKKTYYPSWPEDRYYVTTLEYDSDGLLSRTTTVDKAGNLTSYTVYTNRDGKLMEYTSYDENDKVQYTYKYIYDENGKKLREERYDANGKLEGIDY